MSARFRYRTTRDLAAVRWIHGAPDCDGSTDPSLQVVAAADDTFVIHQSKCVNFEAPFLYLLLGTEMALLHDTGATADGDLFPIRRTVDELMAGRDWDAYRESTRRLARFTRETAARGHPVRSILGAHIEMSTTGELYDLETSYQPDEAPLPLTVDDLFALEEILEEAGGSPRSIPGDRFVVTPVDGASMDL